MNTPIKQKSTPAEIKARFDREVERFSILETGQTATIDAPLSMELISRAAISATPRIGRVLDIGCGAGNNTIKLIQISNQSFDCDLNDLSRPMLDRAFARVKAETSGNVSIYEGDFRTLDFPAGAYDVILAAAVLHHLREESDWRACFKKVFHLLKNGGSFWVTDLVSHENQGVQELMWSRYGSYLESVGGRDYREKVFSYIDVEDSPRPVTFQLELLKDVGFCEVDLLHKNSCFCAFGGVKRSA